MKNKLILVITLFPIIILGQEKNISRPDSEFKSSSVFLNYTNSIFNRPIEEFKYVKTHRGIEIYETYKTTSVSGSSASTIFPKLMPVAVIKDNEITKNKVIYKNYSNSIFNKSIEFSTIRQNTRSIRVNTSKSGGVDYPTYDGGKNINYGESE